MKKLRRRFGADGISACQPQQQRRAAGAAHAEKRFHQPGQSGGGQFSKAQLHQQGRDDQKRKHGRDHRPGTKPQRLFRSAPDGSRIRQKPDQHAAQQQASQGPPPNSHAHHPFISMRPP